MLLTTVFAHVIVCALSAKKSVLDSSSTSSSSLSITSSTASPSVSSLVSDMDSLSTASLQGPSKSKDDEKETRGKPRKTESLYEKLTARLSSIKSVDLPFTDGTIHLFEICILSHLREIDPPKDVTYAKRLIREVTKFVEEN